MKLYLDNSVLNRPFDDQRQPRIWLETLSLGLVLTLIETGQAALIRSFMHDIENARNPFPQRRRWVDKCLGLATTTIGFNETIQTRAASLERAGIKALDAFHLACAEAAEADRFLTCDGFLIRRYSGRMLVQSPIAFITGMA